MSKKTQENKVIVPALIGGIIVAAGVFAGVQLTRRRKLGLSPENLIANCECALAKLVERVGSFAA